MDDPLGDQLRRSAGAFTDGPGPTGPDGPGAGGIGEVRVRSARRRRTRRAVRASAVAAVTLVGVVGVLRLPGRGDNGVEIIGGDRPVTSGSRPAPPENEHAPGSAVPAGSVPPATAGEPTTATTPTTAPRGPVVGPTTTTTAAPVPTPAAGPVDVRRDGLGDAPFDQGYDAALAYLTGRLGAPDDPGTIGAGSGRCGVIHTRDVRWGDLTVSFSDTGAGLYLSGYNWGNTAYRNTSQAHPAPAGPGTPALGNPWGLRLGMPVPSADTLTAQVQRDYPDVRFGYAAPIVDPSIAGAMGRRTLNIGLHAAGDGSLLVERIWVFNPAELFCG
jgi:hypothetical protein